MNTYAPNPKSVECLVCPYPWTTLSIGSSSCDGVYLNLTHSQQTALFTLLAIIFAICLTLTDDTIMQAFVRMLFPTIDVCSDLAYILTNKFYSGTMFSLSLFFLFFSNIVFLYIMYVEGCLSTNVFTIMWRMQYYEPRTRFESAVKSIGGLPYVGWTLVVMVGGFCGVFWCLILAAIGCLLFQMKLYSIRAIRDLWRDLWALGGTYNEADAPNKQEAYKMFFILSMASEVLLEAVPQSILQMMNNEFWNLWTISSLFSTITSLTMAFNGFYFLAYCHRYRGMTAADVYEKMSAFGGHGLELKHQHIKNIKKCYFLPPINDAAPNDIAGRLWNLLTTSFVSTSMTMILIEQDIFNAADLQNVITNHETKRLLTIINHSITLCHTEGCGKVLSEQDLNDLTDILKMCEKHQSRETFYGVLSTIKLKKKRHFLDLAIPGKSFTKQQYEDIQAILAARNPNRVHGNPVRDVEIGNPSRQNNQEIEERIIILRRIKDIYDEQLNNPIHLRPNLHKIDFLKELKTILEAIKL
jgi:hypothetical protein